MSSFTPGLDLYRKVRGAFVMNGSSLNTWCHRNSIHPSNARSALTGNWDGPAGRVMRSRLIRESGLEGVA